MQSQTVILR